MYETTYHRPSSVDEAASAVRQGFGSEISRRRPHADPGHEAAAGLAVRRDRSRQDQGTDRRRGHRPTRVTIKAATTHYDVAQSATVQKAIPALAYLASLIGDPAVRHRGTIGGSIANNDPAADYPAAAARARRDREDQQAQRSSAGRLLQGPVLDRARRRRNHHRRLVPDSGQGGLFQISPSRLALRADRRVRGARPRLATSASPQPAHRKAALCG